MNLSFRYKFEAAHRLSLSPHSKCATPHGHTWYCTLKFSTLTTTLDSKTMVVDFAELKSQWKQFVDKNLDHSFFCNQTDPLIQPLLQIQKDARILYFPEDPTTEHIALLLFLKAEALLNKSYKDLVQVEQILIEETPTNSVVCNRDEDIVLLNLWRQKRGWWNTSNPLSREIDVIE